jgi:IS4 transposase
VFYAKKTYPAKLRRVKDFDDQQKKNLVFIQLLHPARIDCGELYHCRWQIELFFKFVKQHLRIKVFYGTSENAAKTRIWIAISI